jgi:hypothetical protein
MMKHIKIFVTFFYLSAAALAFGAEGTLLYRQTVNVKALSDGVEKTIYSTVGKEKVENQIMLIVTALPSGDIEVRSEKFKLGKMPFSSSFRFIIPQEELPSNAGGLYTLNNLTGVYKVALSKPQALLSGMLSSDYCDLTLAVDGMGKKLTMQLSSKNQAIDIEYETLPDEEDVSATSSDQNQ